MFSLCSICARQHFYVLVLPHLIFSLNSMRKGTVIISTLKLRKLRNKGLCNVTWMCGGGGRLDVNKQLTLHVEHENITLPVREG